MPKGRVPLPHIDYDIPKAPGFVGIRVFHPEDCQEDVGWATLDPGRPRHTRLIICRPHGRETTVTQSIRIEKSDWKNKRRARKALLEAMKIVKRLGADAVCIDGLSEDDKKRFPDLACED